MNSDLCVSQIISHVLNMLRMSSLPSMVQMETGFSKYWKLSVYSPFLPLSARPQEAKHYKSWPCLKRLKKRHTKKKNRENNTKTFFSGLNYVFFSIDPVICVLNWVKGKLVLLSPLLLYLPPVPCSPPSLLPSFWAGSSLSLHEARCAHSWLVLPGHLP